MAAIPVRQFTELLYTLLYTVVAVYVVNDAIRIRNSHA